MSNRDALDRYYTPDSVAVKLVAAVPDLGARVHPLTILEPSCGGGAFMRALRLRWPVVERAEIALSKAKSAAKKRGKK